MPEATEVIRERLLEYGSDVLTTKFPSFVDGLKDITRRIVWFSKERKELGSFLRLMGDIVAQHTSGDSSVYGAIIRLAQPFMVDHPIIHIQGKSGSYYDPTNSGQPRYLEACLSEFGRDLFLTGIHLKTIPMQPTKDFTGMEPKYLIPKLPTALLLGNLTVGFGFKSTIPMYDFGSICDLVMVYADWFGKGNVSTLPSNHSISKLLVPAFPIKNLVKNRTELIARYNTGEYEAPTELEGWCEVNGNNLTLRTVPYGVDFGTVTKTIREMMKDRKCWLWDYITSANQYSTNEAEFCMDVKRGSNPYEVLDKLRSVLKLKSSWKPIFSYMKNGKAVTLSPPYLTYFWYQERAMSIIGGLKYKHTELINRKMFLDAVRHITSDVDAVINIIKNADTEEEAVDIIHNKFKEMTLKQAITIVNQKLSTLIKASKANILQEIDQVNAEINATQDKFQRVNDIIYNDAEVLKKKYGRPKITRYTEEALGLILVHNHGATRYFNIEEMYELMLGKSWPGNSDKEIISLKEDKKELIYIKNNRMLANVDFTARDITCDTIMRFRKFPKKNVFVFRTKFRSNMYPNGLEITTDLTDVVNICSVDNDFISIHKSGIVQTSNWLECLKSRTKSDMIYAINGINKKYLVFHMNTNEPNVVRVDKIRNTGKLHCLAIGETRIVECVEINHKKGIWIFFPTDYTKNTVIDNLYIGDPSSLLKDNEDFRIINVTKDKHIKKDSDCRSIVRLGG